MKKSIKWKFGSAILFLLAGWFGFQLYSINVEYYSEHILLKEKMILTYSEISKNLAASGKIDEIPKVLDSAIHLRQFDWYVVQVDGRTVYAYPDDAKGFPVYSIEREFIEPHVSAKTTLLEPGVYLTVGVNKHKGLYLQKSIGRFISSNLQTLTVSMILVFLTFIYYMKDILSLVSFLKLSRKERVSRLSESSLPKTFEAQVLNQTISSLEQEQHQILEERYLLAKQVLPSLRAELFSGKKPPYEFDCVLVRLDVNGYSKLFLSNKRAEFLKELNQYFIRLTEIVSRYQGFVHEFIGDEVIFYFKHDGKPDIAWLQAVATCRDLESMTNQTVEWTFKAVIAEGRLHFGPMVHGYSLSGDVLITTVRMLKSLEIQKNKNSILLAPTNSQFSHLQLSESIADFTQQDLNSRRDLEPEQKCFIVKNWNNLESILEANTWPLSLVFGFLSGEDLKVWHQYILDSLKVGDEFKVLQLVKSFCEARPDLSDVDSLSSTCRFLDQVLISSVPTKIKSALMQMTKSTLSKSIAVDRSKVDQIEKTLLKYLDGLDHRLVADTIEVIRHFVPRSKHIFERHLHHLNSRVVANVCVALNTDELHKASLQRVVDGIEMGNRSFYYAGQVILEHWKSKDPVVLSSHHLLVQLGGLNPSSKFKVG